MFARSIARPIASPIASRTPIIGGGGGGEPPAWTPANITTALWFDADDASTRITDVGLNGWLDKSGNDRDAGQVNGVAQPALVDWGNGRTCANFDGVNDSMAFVATPQSEARHVFAVVDTTLMQTAYRILLNRTGVGTAPAIYFGSSGGAYRPSIFWDADAARAPAALQRKCMIEWYIGPTTMFTRSDNDNATLAQVSHAKTVLTEWNQISTAPQQANFRLAELVVCPSLLGDSDRLLLWNYFNAKWNIV
jgi:hypothetical protein